ncbi:ATP-binding cassette domain-containing protein [Bifidobacterium actinocoloniiforme]
MTKTSWSRSWVAPARARPHCSRWFTAWTPPRPGQHRALHADFRGQERRQKGDALALLAKLGIDETTTKRKVLRMSGGEQQRVEIAWTLALCPDVIIADEPTGNLDKESERTIMGIPAGLAHQRSKCVLVVTHSQAVAAYADPYWRQHEDRLERKR